MNIKVSRQSRSSVWKASQTKTRTGLRSGADVDDGVVATALEQEAMRLFGVMPEPIWEAGHDGWLPTGPGADETAVEPEPRDGFTSGCRRVEIKARQSRRRSRRLGIDLSRCDDLIFILWQRSGTSPDTIFGRMWYVPNISIAFRPRPIRRTTFGIAQILASGFSTRTFRFK